MKPETLKFLVISIILGTVVALAGHYYTLHYSNIPKSKMKF